MEEIMQKREVIGLSCGGILVRNCESIFGVLFFYYTTQVSGLLYFVVVM
jgi:hypothetical protein